MQDLEDAIAQIVREIIDEVEPAFAKRDIHLGEKGQTELVDWLCDRLEVNFS